MPGNDLRQRSQPRRLWPSGTNGTRFVRDDIIVNDKRGYNPIGHRVDQSFPETAPREVFLRTKYRIQECACR